MSRKNKRQAPKSSAVSTPASLPVEFSRLSDREFNPDYSYVIKDLKRIGLLAGTFLAILVALAFFLR